MPTRRTSPKYIIPAHIVRAPNRVQMRKTKSKTTTLITEPEICEFDGGCSCCEKTDDVFDEPVTSTTGENGEGVEEEDEGEDQPYYGPCSGCDVLTAYHEEWEPDAEWQSGE